MNTEYIRALINYNYWASRRILDAAMGVSAEDYDREVLPTAGALRRWLEHIPEAEWLWRQRCTVGSPKTFPEQFRGGTLATLRERWAEDEEEMRAWVWSLDDAALDRRIHYVNLRGQAFVQPVWQILAHVVNHGTQHRSEAALLLTNLGCSPGEMDLWAFLRVPD